MPPRSKPGELPKPVVKKNSMGGLPLNPLTLSCLHEGYADCLLGFRDHEQTLALKNRSVCHLSEGRKKIAVTISGRFFNSYSDALYRGQLPEVLLAAPSADWLPDYLRDFTEYVERLATLGFFIPGKQLIQRDAVGELVPCTILLGSGLLFSRFVTGLLASLKSLEHDHPSLNEAVRLRILGRFVRGFPGAEAATSYSEPLMTAANTIAPFTPFPKQLRIAGGDRWTQKTIQSVLSHRGLITEIETQPANAPERLELKNALWRLTGVILPGLVAQKQLSEKEAKALAPKLQQNIWTIGMKRAALLDSDQADFAPAAPTNGKSTAKATAPAKKETTAPAIPLGWGDVAIVASLNGYAKDLNLPEASQLFETMTQQLLACCQTEKL